MAYSIKYGPVGSQYTLTNPDKPYLLNMDVTSRGFNFRQEFVITATTAALFKAAVDTARDKLSYKHGHFTVVWDDQTLYDFNPTNNSGFILTPSFTKDNDQNKNGKYTAKCVFQLTGLLPNSVFFDTTNGVGDISIRESRSYNNIPSYTFNFDIRAEGGNSASTNYATAVGDTGVIREWLRNNASPAEVAVGADYYPKYNLKFETSKEDQNKTITTQVVATYQNPRAEKDASPYQDNRFMIQSSVISSAGDTQMGYNPFDNGVYALGSPIPIVMTVQYDIVVDRTQVDWNSLPTIIYGDGNFMAMLIYHLEQSWQSAGLFNTNVNDFQIDGSPVVSTDFSNSMIRVNLQLRGLVNGFLASMQHDIEYTEDLGEVDLKILDGQDYTYETQSPVGKTTTAVQTITGTVVGRAAPNETQWRNTANENPGPSGDWKVKKTIVKHQNFQRAFLSTNQSANKVGYDFIVIRLLKYKLSSESAYETVPMMTNPPQFGNS